MRFRLSRRSGRSLFWFDAARPTGGGMQSRDGAYAEGRDLAVHVPGTPDARGLTEQERADAKSGGGVGRDF